MLNNSPTSPSAPTDQMSTESISDCKQASLESEAEFDARVLELESLSVSKSKVSNPEKWGPIIPFEFELESDLEFPLESLPLILKEAVSEVQEYAQAPAGLIALSALFPLAASGQRIFNIIRDGGTTIPPSLFTIVLAKSGERKSTVDKIFSKPLYDHQKQNAERYRRQLATYKAAYTVWEKKLGQLQESIGASKAITAEEDLAAHLATEPTRPVGGDLLLDDITPEALLLHMSEKNSRVALHSAEGASILGSRQLAQESQLQTLSSWNKFWDGGDVRSDRKEAKSAYVKDGRLCIGLAVQPGVFFSFLQSSKNIPREIGFFARCLMCHPISTQGTRMFKHRTGTGPKVEKYYTLLRKLLNKGDPLLENGTFETLSISHEAMDYWINFYNVIEAKVGPLGEYNEASDLASRCAEIAIRLSGLFVLANADGETNVIDLESMEQACKIAEWGLKSSIQIFDSCDQHIQKEKLKKGLIYLLKHRKISPSFAILTSDIIAKTRIFRKKLDLEEMMLCFVTNNIARFGNHQATVVELNPVLFTCDNPLQLVGLDK